MRGWFHANGYFEVETPVRIPAPAPEPHIDCPPSADEWLRASPELQMKRLLAAGADRIFRLMDEDPEAFKRIMDAGREYFDS